MNSKLAQIIPDKLSHWSWDDKLAAKSRREGKKLEELYKQARLRGFEDSKISTLLQSGKSNVNELLKLMESLPKKDA